MRLLTLALLAASAAFASTDFTGSWKLNSAKSDFGQLPKPSALTEKVTHADPKLTIETKMAGDQGEFAFSATYSTDGKETTNQSFGGSQAKSVANWDGETLVIDTKGSFGDNPYAMKERRSLSPDGKVLTIQRHFSSPMGDADQKIVLDKE